MHRLVAVASAVVVVIASSACTPASACPRTVDEARQVTWDDEIVGGGYVIRFVPGTQATNRGYEINLTRPVSERAQMDTYVLQTPVEIEGMADATPVLLIGARTDRAHRVVAGACPPLTSTTDEDVTWREKDQE